MQLSPFFQISMSVLLELITAILMLLVPTLLVVSPVPVIRDLLELERGVWVSSADNAINAIKLILQISMSVLLELITAILMLLVPTLLVVSPVPVIKDTLELERGVWVSGASNAINAIKPILQISMSVLLKLITVILMLLVSTLLVASPVPVTRDMLEMESRA